MQNAISGPRNERPVENRYYYSCWPFPWGGRMCGVALVAIGAGMMLQRMFPGAGDAIWGAILVGLGIVVLGAAMRGDEAG